LHAVDRCPPVPIAENGEPFENVEKLSHVPGPGVGSKELHGFPGAAEVKTFARAELLEEERNVTGPFAERRDVEGKDIQAVKEILPEPTLAA
jgi:hypothetical protein